MRSPLMIGNRSEEELLAKTATGTCRSRRTHRHIVSNVNVPGTDQ